jgi:hypothetical protein
MTNKLREEFKKTYPILFESDEFYDEVADFFLSKRAENFDGILGEINGKRKIKVVFQKFWYYCGQWHDAECDFIMDNAGCCNCKFAKNIREINEIIKLSYGAERDLWKKRKKFG